MDYRVGIVCPIYNGQKYLAQTLDSILAQTESNWTCVLVDDGSTDDSAAIADRYVQRDKRFTLIRQSNAGVSKARTTGYAVLDASSDFLIFLDADDIWHPSALRRLIETIEMVDGSSAVHATAKFIDADGRPMQTANLDERLKRMEYRGGRIVEVSTAESTTSAMLATWPCIITPGIVLIRRDAWIKSGGWDATLSIGEDWELWYRLSLISPISYIDEPLIQYRIYASSSSSNWRRPFKLAAARARVIDSPISTPSQRKFARSACRAMYRRLGTRRCSNGLKTISEGKIGGGARSIMSGAINLALGLKPW